MKRNFAEGGDLFSDRYPKNQYVELTKQDVRDYKQDIFDIINSSYAYIGGHIEFQKPDDIVNSDLNFWIGADIDEDPEVDTIIGGKTTNYGTKLTASAQDGTKNAKVSVMKKMGELLATKGFYGETNVDLAKKRGSKWVTDEKIIRRVVGKPDIVMNEDGSYTRKIGGEPHTKVLVGYFDHISDGNYKNGGKMKTNNLMKPTKSINEIAKEFNKSPKFIREQLELGINHEMEHFYSKTLAEKTALHHLAEDPLYYIHIGEMEMRLEAEKLEGYYKNGGSLESETTCEIFDEDGNRKIDAESIENLTECVNNLPQTKSFHFDFSKNDYKPYRKQLHRDIIYEFKKDLVCVDREQPIAILMGGSPASGKSTFLKKYAAYLLKEEIFKVDADEIRARLPEYRGYNASQTHLETKDIVTTLLSDRNIGIPCKFDLIYDGTMNSTKSYLPLIQILKKDGYKVFIVYIDKVDKKDIVKRALERYKKAGRFVPLEVIDDFFEKGTTALNQLKKEVDGYMIIDGSNKEYEIIERGGEELPQDRNYSKIGTKINITSDKVIKDFKNGGQIDPDNEVVKNYFAGGSGSTGGVLVGKRHSEGGIKAINKATNTPIEMEGGEVVITRNAVSDDTKREFEGQMLTNKEILSKINESGGGVSLYEDGGNVRCSFCTGKKYKYGGEMVSDYDIYNEMMAKGGGLGVSKANNQISGKYAWLQTNNIFSQYPTTQILSQKEFEKTFEEISNDREFYLRVDEEGNKLFVRKSDNYNIEFKLKYIFRDGGMLDDDRYGKPKNDYEESNFADGGEIEIEDFNGIEQELISHFIRTDADYVYMSRQNVKDIQSLIDKGLFYITQSANHYNVEVHTTKLGRKVLSNMPVEAYENGGMTDCGCIHTFENGGLNTQDYGSFQFYKGTKHKYANQYQINKAIEELLEKIDSKYFTPEEVHFLTYFAGYGGLEKYGAKGVGLLYEYFTPSKVAKTMWGLAYKHGFQGGKVLEPSCGIGEFIKYAPNQNLVTGYEINKTSAKICKILYPNANIQSKYFEELFIKNNFTIRNKVDGMQEYSLVIGNPPYGEFKSYFGGMGEKDYTKAHNYIEYFILRGLDLLESGGLLIYIIGTEVAMGGKPFLQKEMTDTKKLISEKADLIDAYRLPNGIFETTDVLSDIIILKKK